MLEMTLLEHMEELRARLIRILIGTIAAYAFAVCFAGELWRVVSAPAASALRQLGVAEKLYILSPMDGFLTIYVKLPLLAALFLASPWILWQVWAFIAPGLYPRERRFAGPFVLCSAGLFVAGGCFAYFVAFRLGLVFLLGIAVDKDVRPAVSIVEYFDVFINVTLGLGLLFELPVLTFFFILLRLVTPAFLLEQSRHAILGIVVLAAAVSPTTDPLSLTIFAGPLILLYFAGVFVGWLYVMRRDRIPFPWRVFFLCFLVTAVLLVGGIMAFLMLKLGFHFVAQWPFLMK